MIDERDQEVMQLVLQVTAGMWAEIRLRRTISLLNDTEGNKKRRSRGGERGNESRISSSLWSLQADAGEN